MRTIGFHGGSLMHELGSASDVKLFFDCISAFPAHNVNFSHWNILTDRLYRRYLSFEELDIAISLMDTVKEVFYTIPSSSVQWDSKMIEKNKTLLNPNLPTLGDVFSDYFKGFADCVLSAKIFYEDWGIYQPVRVGTTDIPHYIVDKNRSLEEYNDLTGDPFWMSSQ